MPCRCKQPHNDTKITFTHRHKQVGNSGADEVLWLLMIITNIQAEQTIRWKCCSHHFPTAWWREIWEIFLTVWTIFLKKVLSATTAMTRKRVKTPSLSAASQRVERPVSVEGFHHLGEQTAMCSSRSSCNGAVVVVVMLRSLSQSVPCNKETKQQSAITCREVKMFSIHSCSPQMVYE